MRSNAILGALIGLATAAAQAGPSLDAALARVPPFTAALEVEEGLETTPAGPGGDAPWLVPGGAPTHYVAHLVSRTQTSGPLHLRVGFAWSDGTDRAWSLDGSVLALGLGGSELYASVERRHWGPGWMGSLILDGSAPALPAIGWRTTNSSPSPRAWLRWLGPWSADVFMGQLKGHTEPARPWLVGMRVQLQPIESLQIGLSRTMQWGGAGRDESLGSLVNGLLGRDNVGNSGVDAAHEPGNQLAGIDWRWTPAGRETMSLYGQVVGEDEANLMPSLNMRLLGADVAMPGTRGDVRLFVEGADTLAGGSGGRGAGVAYRHHIYHQGYTNDGMLLGHPAGGDMRLLSAGAIVRHGRSGAMFALSSGQALATTQRFVEGRVLGLNAASHFDVTADQRLGAGLWWWRDNAGTRGAAQLWWQYRH
jgi:Capsule assembly protein Wzi